MIDIIKFILVEATDTEIYNLLILEQLFDSNKVI